MSLRSVFFILVTLSLSSFSTASTKSAIHAPIQDVKLKYTRVKAADAQSSHCLSEHLREAIELNSERKKIYSAMTEGKSEKISDRLIFLEKLARSTVFLLDGDRVSGKLWGSYMYNKVGIPIFCADVESMTKATELRMTSPVSLPPWKKLPIKQMQADLRKALQTASWEKIENTSLQWFEALNRTPQFGCMTRHFIESIARVAGHAEDYRKMAKEMKLPDPQNLLLFFISNMILALKQGGNLDVQALPFQVQGIPILCNDVPPLIVHHTSH